MCSVSNITRNLYIRIQEDRIVCKLTDIAETLDPEKRAALALDLVDDRVHHTEIAEALSLNGSRISEQVVRRHRIGICNCVTRPAISEKSRGLAAKQLVEHLGSIIENTDTTDTTRKLPMKKRRKAGSKDSPTQAT